jgi:nucleoside-diphosphate-sugar epimerase
MSKTLIVGCGDIGYQLAIQLCHKGHVVTALKRRPLDATPPFEVFLADIRQPQSLQGLAVDFDTMVFIVSPDGRDAASYQALFHDGLRNVLEHFAQAGSSPRVLMVSSTSVYGQQTGEWVDETSPTEPDSATARCLVAAERLLEQYDTSHCVIRFSGIYGPGRTWLLRRAASDEPIQHQPPSYTNRIHVDDCVGVLLFLLEKHWKGTPLQACYLASDDEPVPLWDVMLWLKRRLGQPPPQALPHTDCAPQNKRCCNARLKALGYRFRYPGYQDGYDKLLTESR